MFLEQSGFQNWMTERKDLPDNETCVKIVSDGNWLEMNCSDEINIVCEKPKCKSTFKIYDSHSRKKDIFTIQKISNSTQSYQMSQSTKYHDKNIWMFKDINHFKGNKRRFVTD